MVTLQDSDTPFLFFTSGCRHIDHVLEEISAKIAEEQSLDGSDLALAQATIDEMIDEGPDWTKRGVVCFHAQAHGMIEELSVLIRLDEPIGRVESEGRRFRFVWVLISGEPTHPHLDSAIEFTNLLKDPGFRHLAETRESKEMLFEGYRLALEEHVRLGASKNAELAPSGRLFGGLLQDLKRKLPHLVGDYIDGFSSKTIASVVFLFFACLAPAIAFGGLLSVLTDGQIGVVEMLVATALGGVAYALFSGQPLTILGSTGPVIIFMGMVYGLTESLGIPYLPTIAWIGFWTCLMLIVLVAVDACCWIRYFTRFTDEIFAALISLIFIVEAVKDMVHVFTDQKVSHDTALLSLVLALGTFWVGSNLSRFRRAPYLRKWAREFLADFGPAIAMVLMTCVAFALHEVNLETLAVPDSVATTSGRPWLVDIGATPMWARWAAIVPAGLVSILVYLDQNITVRLVNNPDNKLTKGSGYHLDLLVVALLIGVFSLFGLPWMVAATVRSLNHVRSLAKTELDSEGREKTLGVLESRMSGLLVHLAIGFSLFFLNLLALIPMSVLFGLFLYMGVASMSGNTLFERMRLWIMDPSQYPTNSVIRAVPSPVVHRFTFIQTACLGVLWLVKTSVLGILFPLFIGLLVPVRRALEGHFKDEHLDLLDAEEEPDDDFGDIGHV
jgi:HCO3- transporter integral membrane domain